MIYGRLFAGWTVPSMPWILWCFCVVLLQIQFRIEMKKGQQTIEHLAPSTHSQCDHDLDTVALYNESTSTMEGT